MSRRGVRADMGRTKGDGGGMVTRISVGAVFAASPALVSSGGGEALDEAGEAGLSAADEVEVKVVADDADDVRDVGGLSSKVNLVLVPVGMGLMRAGERALRKST